MAAGPCMLYRKQAGSETSVTSETSGWVMGGYRNAQLIWILFPQHRIPCHFTYGILTTERKKKL